MHTVPRVLFGLAALAGSLFLARCAAVLTQPISLGGPMGLGGMVTLLVLPVFGAAYLLTSWLADKAGGKRRWPRLLQGLITLPPVLYYLYYWPPMDDGAYFMLRYDRDDSHWPADKGLFTVALAAAILPMLRAGSLPGRHRVLSCGLPVLAILLAFGVVEAACWALGRLVLVS